MDEKHGGENGRWWRGYIGGWMDCPNACFDVPALYDPQKPNAGEAALSRHVHVAGGRILSFVQEGGADEFAFFVDVGSTYRVASKSRMRIGEELFRSPDREEAELVYESYVRAMSDDVPQEVL